MRHNFVVATAEWATQRSDPDFTPIDAISVLDLLLGYNNVAIVKKRKKLNKERKERFRGRCVLENDQMQK